MSDSVDKIMPGGLSSREGFSSASSLPSRDVGNPNGPSAKPVAQGEISDLEKFRIRLDALRSLNPHK